MPKKKSELTYLPLPLVRALKKFGADIRNARRVRKIPVSVMAERASISRTTLSKIEKGEPGVSFGSYAMVLFILGLTKRLSDLIDIKHDAIGLDLIEEDLPIRIRKSIPKGGSIKKGKK